MLLRRIGSLRASAAEQAAGTTARAGHRCPCPRRRRSTIATGSADSNARRPVDYESYLSARSKARRPSAIRALQPLLAEPGMISLGGGMPNKATFPFESISVGLKGGGTFELDGDDLVEVLQYSGTRGLGSLIPHLVDIQTAEHGTVTPQPHEICVSTGSQDGLSKAFDLFTADGFREAPVLVEKPTYSGSLAYLQPTGTRLVGVPCDTGGLDPAALDAILRTWDCDASPRPRVLYTIPVGSNPTGASLTLERKHEIYKIAREFELIILEDDPYYWMQFAEQRIPSCESSPLKLRLGMLNL
jgi:kynurenine/2-aminoadipate aminotransferase